MHTVQYWPGPLFPQIFLTVYANLRLFVPGDSALTWCRLAYWEERTRVGAQVSGTKRALEVFTSQPRPSASHDAVSLETLHSLNPKPSQATLRTREKIGLGEK